MRDRVGRAWRLMRSRLAVLRDAPRLVVPPLVGMVTCTAGSRGQPRPLTGAGSRGELVWGTSDGEQSFGERRVPGLTLPT